MQGLLALDLDGTLLNKYQEISPMNQKAVRYAKNRGYELAIATGRSIQDVDLSLICDLSFRYLISLNGARVFDLHDNSVLAQFSMDKQIAYELFNEFPATDTFRTLYCENVTYCPIADKENVYKLGYGENNIQTFLKKITFVDDPVAVTRENGEEVIKMSIDLVKGENLEKNKKRMLSLKKEYSIFNCVSGGFDCFDFTSKDASKGNGLKLIAQKTGLDLQKSVAIGDSENDLSMIQAARFGIAMGNGEEILKKNADFITRCCEEDGVAIAIYSYM